MKPASSPLPYRDRISDLVLILAARLPKEQRDQILWHYERANRAVGRERHGIVRLLRIGEAKSSKNAGKPEVALEVRFGSYYYFFFFVSRSVFDFYLFFWFIFPSAMLTDTAM